MLEKYVRQLAEDVQKTIWERVSAELFQNHGMTHNEIDALKDTVLNSKIIEIKELIEIDDLL